MIAGLDDGRLPRADEPIVLKPGEIGRASFTAALMGPSEQVDKWKNSGMPSTELLSYIRVETERSPREVELLPSRSIALRGTSQTRRESTADGRWETLVPSARHGVSRQHSLRLAEILGSA